ncbi:MAG: hypothetical protein R2788_00690 [Saprospiraceae bacterium]
MKYCLTAHLMGLLNTNTSTKVEIKDFTNALGNNNGYADFTSCQPVDLIKGKLPPSH